VHTVTLTQINEAMRPVARRRTPDARSTRLWMATLPRPWEGKTVPGLNLDSWVTTNTPSGRCWVSLSNRFLRGRGSRGTTWAHCYRASGR
jgi:hypothetical protein